METKRDQWEFEYTASKLVEGAKTKKESHEKRLAWWEGKKLETMQKVKDGGISIHDSVAAGYSNTKGGFGPQIEIEGGLQRDLNECHIKLKEHEEKIRVYDGWIQVLSANPESRLKLTHDDWLFFFGK